MGLIAPAREQGKTMGIRQFVSRHILKRHLIAKSHGTGLGLLREVAAMTQSPEKGEDDMRWIWRNFRNWTEDRGSRYQRNFERDRAVATLRAALLFVFMSFVLAMLISSAR